MKFYPIIVIASATLLTGCGMMSAVSTLMTFSDLPVPRATVKAGANKQSVLAAGQPDSTYQISNSSGICFDYVLQKEGKTSNFFVAFNSQTLVKGYGFTTCREADNQGALKTNEAMKQRY
ncbi:hypothetical protein [Chitinimonas sp. BJB300]|uniref:hypothetical protein n=1 Tax=Chitinimonas sp. BJB300 TaxID=1559339 RepID=UPI000C1022E1|nr:hypothetical protein [Chitinimonas sp. BJB300]PHV10940.1 hypothetical protein CSQ89_13550 [Chitinimonas sp. BJB300]TSJ86038.1 hypothetical protein FG002_016895 [Chitinimonas sp. BJB300]